MKLAELPKIELAVFKIEVGSILNTASSTFFATFLWPILFQLSAN